MVLNSKILLSTEVDTGFGVHCVRQCYWKTGNNCIIWTENILLSVWLNISFEKWLGKYKLSSSRNIIIRKTCYFWLVCLNFDNQWEKDLTLAVWWTRGEKCQPINSIFIPWEKRGLENYWLLKQTWVYPVVSMVLFDTFSIKVSHCS